jgi:hypothetical protein
MRVQIAGHHANDHDRCVRQDHRHREPGDARHHDKHHGAREHQDGPYEGDRRSESPLRPGSRACPRQAREAGRARSRISEQEHSTHDN